MPTIFDFFGRFDEACRQTTFLPPMSASRPDRICAMRSILINTFTQSDEAATLQHGGRDASSFQPAATFAC
jgi:hypothetical protein